MLRNIVRLGGVSVAPGISKQQIVNRMSAASFHWSRANAVAVSPNAATSPSVPLPPPMATSTQINSSVRTPSTTASTPASTPASVTSEESVSQQAAAESEEEGEEEPTQSEFVEPIPLAPEQARSLTVNPILTQFINTIMKDGKKARAEKFVADAMLEIRRRTQSDPYQVTLDAIELASPILKLTAVKKGSKVLQVPTPMTERQRRRKAIVWIVEASDKRSKAEKEFKNRLASEILAVVNGNSGALVKKSQLHKMALANRANASLKY
ncbi:hypothetical protein BG011_009210 [Mortierella polycephala]|uniref:Small ribosomal subunit protein uS7 domain-containing protein n=1 Tax=Mortierella polycephala TaxID=41804 RepID=A0A9P6PMM3_9FUNG|nr:hypothetical protein BG011_009210 [Mortierella polycephala]